MTQRAYKNHLRYKHMVARLDKLPTHKLESEVLAELAKGKRWRIEAALDALEKCDERYTHMHQTLLFETAGRYGRLTAMHRLTNIYEAKKIDRNKSKHVACSHGVLEAFDMAVVNDHYRVATYLLQFGVHPDFTKNNHKPQYAMALAIEQEDTKKIAYLLKAGASATYHLTCAAQSGTVKAARQLLDAGADVNAKARHWTPLHLAARAGDHAMVDLLVEYGAQVDHCANDLVYDVVGRDDLSMLDRLLTLGAQPYERDFENAVKEGNLAIAERLLAAGLTLTPETLVNVLYRQSTPEAVVLCLNNGVSPADAIAWLEGNPDRYRYGTPGAREDVMAKLQALITAPVAQQTPKPPKVG